jgi:hypothetical protein
MLDFGERDLIRFVDDAGFAQVHAEIQFNIGPSPDLLGWQTLLHTAFNPKIPTLQEAMDEALTAEEQARFVAHLRPLVDAHTSRAFARHWRTCGR